MHAHKPFKNPIFFLQLQLQPQPSVFCYGGLYPKPRLTCHPTSQWLTPGPQMEADLAGFAFFFFFFDAFTICKLHTMKTFQASSGLIRQEREALQRQWGEEGKKSNRFYFSFAAILPIAPMPRRETDWARFASAGTWVQHAGHRGRLKAGSWKKKYNTKKRSKSRTNWYFRDEEGDFIIFLSCALWFCEKKRPATAFIFVLFLLQKPALTPARGTGTWINSAYKPATLYATSGVRRKIWNFMWALLSRHIIAPNVITHSRC